jgi:putative regulator of septum formation
VRRPQYAVLALLAVVAGALGACGTETPSAALKTGDCVNQGLTVDATGSQVREYTVVDCGSAHDAEVFSVFDYPNATAQFPGYEQIGAVEQTGCQRDFTAYVGIDWADSSYTINYVAPTERTWAQGDRSIKCLAEDSTGEAKITGSVRGSKK